MAIVSAAPRQSTASVSSRRFDEVLALIEAAQARAYQAVNIELIDLYWKLGEYISKKIGNAKWGDGVVEELAATIARRYPGVRGHTRPNLFRMRQFYDAYRDHKKVSALLRQLPWTHPYSSSARRSSRRSASTTRSLPSRAGGRRGNSNVSS